MVIDTSAIKGMVSDLYEAKVKYDDAKSAYDEMRTTYSENLISYMSRNNANSFRVSAPGESTDDEDAFLKVIKCQNTSVEYDIKKLRRVLEDDILNDCIDKKYECIDFDKLKQLARDAGINPKDFKSCFEITESVNQKRLDLAAEMGLFSTSEIVNCGKIVPVSKEYIKLGLVRIAKGDDEDWGSEDEWED